MSEITLGKITELINSTPLMLMPKEKCATISNSDAVNHPSHYTSGKIEVIDYITDQNLDFALGNVVKYVSRAGKKHEEGMDDLDKMIQDLEKAQFYLRHKIAVLKRRRNNANKA